MTRRTNLRSGLAVAAAVILLPTTLGANGFDEPDADTEFCLAEGEILKKKRKTLKGVTRPQLYTIVCSGQERRAVVKSLHESKLGLTRFEKGLWEVNFTDSYLYERAAYLLDRELGLNMVPVAVIREIRRGESAFVEFIDQASFERDSPHTPSGRERAELAREKAIMRLFDALIYNTDRNTQNLLVDDQNWRLYLIDHSRAFRQVSDLPEEGWVQTRARLSSELYERLKSLEEAPLVELLAGVLSEAQVRTLLARRDKIIQKIDDDRDEFGDGVVFSG